MMNGYFAGPEPVLDPLHYRRTTMNRARPSHRSRPAAGMILTIARPLWSTLKHTCAVHTLSTFRCERRRHGNEGIRGRQRASGPRTEDG